ncbi:MAG TPA: ATP-binding protein [Nocardioides sp.]
MEFDGPIRFDQRAATETRHRFLTALLDRGTALDVAEDAALVLYELLQNGIEHGAPCPDGALHVCWRVDGALVHLAVTDGGRPGTGAEAWRERRLREPDPMADRGRGLHLVHGLSRAWSVETTPAGTTVRAVVPVG